MKQKARVKWVVEGDVNSKLFHAGIRGRRKSNTLKGLLINGNWTKDPDMIKNAVLDYIRRQLKSPMQNSPDFRSQRFKKLIDIRVLSLEAPFLEEEIK